MEELLLGLLGSYTPNDNIEKDDRCNEYNIVSSVSNEKSLKMLINYILDER